MLAILIVLIIIFLLCSKKEHITDNYSYFLRKDKPPENCMETVSGGVHCFPWKSWPRIWGIPGE